MIVGNSVVEKKMKTLRMSLQNHPTLLVNPIYERLVLSRSERLVIIHHLGEGGFLEDHMILRGKVGDQSSPTEQKGEGL